MRYVKPENVTSPRSSWRLAKVLYDGGEGQWAAAEGQWDNDGRWEDRIALRWNGYAGSKIGNPQSRGLATWFMVPFELADVVRAEVEKLTGSHGRRRRG